MDRDYAIFIQSIKEIKDKLFEDFAALFTLSKYSDRL